MVNDTVTGSSIAKGSNTLAQGSTYIGEALNEVTLWFSRISIFEWILIIFIIIISLILVFIKGKTNKNLRDHYRPVKKVKWFN